MWAYIKNSYIGLNGTTYRGRWMDHLLMQSMVKAWSVSKENEAGISHCIFLSLICAVRGKNVLMKGTCLPLDPTGKWGQEMHIEFLKNRERNQTLANRTWAASRAVQPPLILFECCVHRNKDTDSTHFVPLIGLEKGQGCLLQSPSLISPFPLLLESAWWVNMLSPETTPSNSCPLLKHSSQGKSHRSKPISSLCHSCHLSYSIICKTDAGEIAKIRYNISEKVTYFIIKVLSLLFWQQVQTHWIQWWIFKLTVSIKFLWKAADPAMQCIMDKAQWLVGPVPKYEFALSQFDIYFIMIPCSVMQQAHENQIKLSD